MQVSELTFEVFKFSSFSFVFPLDGDYDLAKLRISTPDATKLSLFSGSSPENPETAPPKGTVPLTLSYETFRPREAKRSGGLEY